MDTLFFIIGVLTMKLFLYDVVDGDNVINKDLPVPVEIEIRLSNDVDVINPELRLRNVEGINYDDYNYAFIDVLGRYYFVNKLGRVSATDNILYLSCDVLETYKDEILNSNARFTRNLKTGDFYNGSIDSTINKSVMIYNGDVTLNSDVSNLIVSVVGG